MKKAKKCIAIILAACVFGTGFGASAKSSYIEQARIFYQLGLYNGIGSSYFEPDLDFFLDRETAMVFLGRLMGPGQNAMREYERSANSILNSYGDAYLVSGWAKAYVAYAVKNNIISDFDDGRIMPKEFIYGKTFSTMLLRFLGINLSAEQSKIAMYVNSYLGGVLAEEAKYLNDKMITKNDMIGIVWESLTISDYNGVTLLEKIIQTGGFSSDRLRTLGFTYHGGKPYPPVLNTISLYSEHTYQSVYNMKDGSPYIGETQWGIPNGYGAVNYSDGSRYEGHVSDGLRHGEGTLVRNDGFVYRGTWKDDYMNGYAVMNWPNGDTYEGDVLAGQMFGQGTMRWSNGDMYSGEWENGNFEGYGRFNWRNGNYYEGFWSGGRFNGYGTFRWPSGEVYEGSWQDGKRQGYGKLTTPEGEEKTGIWHNDVFGG